MSSEPFKYPIEDNIGGIPTMTSIKSLILSHNPVGGPIPKSFGKLNELQVLELEGNDLSGNKPVELVDAKELTTILLSKNKLSGNFPKTVMNLKRLQNFNVSRNSMSGRVPHHNAGIPASAFKDNPGLCGSPLPPCKCSIKHELTCCRIEVFNTIHQIDI
ncbi:probable leucine-rich repeat receptor-like protein kinase At1g68400 [Mangifera indica]|uniref:probable leucine-rich repeat receptor-like protein kinase At1g68400 n=1 Tax=Mangifera indica TaxID=29780 RepID=UPI001CFA5D98|nr:probable leucine-rich repeat receptor-like protein kinase At1g68400 [Mangifera indica]